MIYLYLQGVYKFTSPLVTWKHIAAAPCHLVQHHVFDHSDARVWGPALHAVRYPKIRTRSELLRSGSIPRFVATVPGVPEKDPKVP